MTRIHSSGLSIYHIYRTDSMKIEIGLLRDCGVSYVILDLLKIRKEKGIYICQRSPEGNLLLRLSMFKNLSFTKISPSV